MEEVRRTKSSSTRFVLRGSRWGRFGPLLGISLFTFACDPGSPAPATRPAPVVTQADTPCPGQQEVPTEPPGGSLQGLIDPGDRTDEVFLYEDLEAEPGCRHLLVLSTGEGAVVSTPIRIGDAEVAGGGLPALAGVAEIDERPGSEVVVDVVAGASTAFVAVFSAGGGVLEQMTITGGGPYGDLFPYGGSTGHMEASDCVEGTPGEVAITLVEPSAGGYRLTMTVFVTENGKFEERRKLSERLSEEAALESLQGMGSVPFGSCPTG